MEKAERVRSWMTSHHLLRANPNPTCPQVPFVSNRRSVRLAASAAWRSSFLGAAIGRERLGPRGALRGSERPLSNLGQTPSSVVSRVSVRGHQQARRLGLVSGRGRRDPSRSPQRGVENLVSPGRPACSDFLRRVSPKRKGGLARALQARSPMIITYRRFESFAPLEADCSGVAVGLALMPQTR
jgi:hypothetical protein